jgi:ribosomal protein S18 acetylase RimI-like enzyme
MNICIRPCTVEDAETLKDLATKAFCETFAPLNTPENMDAYLQEAYNLPKLRRELEDGNQEFYFSYADGVLAGYLKVNEAPSQAEFNDPKALEIERIYVLKSFYGTGVGQFLMDAALEMARTRGKEYTFLGVWEYNLRARRFYEKNGFYRFGAHTFVMGDDPQTDFLLRKDLL